MTDGGERESESTWAKLRRRKVVQWGVAYAAVAWGLLQGLGLRGRRFSLARRDQAGRPAALAGEADQAIATLELGLKNVLRDGAGFFESDPAFRELRNDPRFKALMERYRERYP